MTHDAAQPSRHRARLETLALQQRGDDVLLMFYIEVSDCFAGLCNAIGGHAEVGEDVWGVARRELMEETSIGTKSRGAYV